MRLLDSGIQIKYRRATNAPISGKMCSLFLPLSGGRRTAGGTCMDLQALTESRKVAT